MQIFTVKPIVITALIWGGSSIHAFAQDSAADISVEAEQIEAPTINKKVKRVTEALPYWVESQQLRVRDNPYAGDVVGMLKIGDKVKVSKSVDSWVLISDEGAPEKWVNRDFLSTSPVTWANYKFDSRGSRSFSRDRFAGDQFDTKVKRIKVKGLKDVRVSAADIKRIGGDKKLVISRHDYRAGPYYEKHIVQCSEESATHIKILGEGYTVMMMEADPRQQRIGAAMAETDLVEREEISAAAKAIAEFTCKTDKL